MDPNQPTSQNPLGLNIDFLFGRGYLWAKRERLSDWITLESLRMEIPDLQFPFDARGGLHRFRNTRCLVREIELTISEVGLQDLLARAASYLEGFRDLRLRFGDDTIHVSFRVRAFGADTYVSFRAALIPPEPARADELHLSLYDYRAFGPLPYPARLLVYELMTSMLNTPVLKPPGRGSSFTVGLAGDIISFRPLKLLLLNIFPRVGWKLPNLAGVVLDGARLRPGQLTLRASSRDESWYTSVREPSFQLTSTQEGARALAAYEAKDMFSHVDQALFEGRMDQAMSLLATYRDIYGPHEELIARALDCLLSDPTPGNLAEAGAIVRELEREDTLHLQAALAEPVLAMLGDGRPDKIVAAFDRLAEALRRRQDLDDWILCALTAVSYVEEDRPQEAVARLRDVLKIAPRHQAALEQLVRLYERLGDWGGYEEMLKRLTGVYTEREQLKRTYITLAHHLMDRRGQVAEARLYLEKVLRLAPGEFEALNTLGESYVLSQEPLRALKAFGSAARAAEADGQVRDAAKLHVRIARLWRQELDNPAEALLSCRRALQLQQSASNIPVEEVLEALELAAALCEQRERPDEALAVWMEIIPRLEALAERAPAEEALTGAAGALGGLLTLEAGQQAAAVRREQRARLVNANMHVARLYVQRGRAEAASPYWRRALELEPTQREAMDALEAYYRERGRPEELIGFWRGLLEQPHAEGRRVELRLRLAQVYELLGLVEEAREQYVEALRLEPTHREARVRLVELLRSAGRYETLRDILGELLVRLRDREVRHELLMLLGDVLLHGLSQPRQAARTFFEALDIKPTGLEALLQARDALDMIIAREGFNAPAPVGPDTVARLQERVLQRVVELTQDSLDRGQALDELANLAERRGDKTGADEARRRAAGLRRERDVSEEEPRPQVDTRLDELLGERLRGGTPAERASGQEQASPAPRHDEDEGDVGPLVLGQLGLGGKRLGGDRQTKPLPTLPKLKMPGAAAQALAPAAPTAEEAPKLDVFRAKMQDIWKTPGSLAAAAKSAEAGGSPLARLFKRDTPQQGVEGVVRAPQVTPSGEVTRVPGVTEFKETRRTTDAVSSLEARLYAVEQARQAGKPEEIVATITALLDAVDAPDSVLELPQARYLALARELGEVLYFDLEDGASARPYLELVRERDPEGLGAEPALLTALESIYEETGELGRRIKVLEERLKRAQTDDMITTYRLLIAQLLWDEGKDAEAARGRLQEILAVDKQNEAALRLMAQIARESGDYHEAVRHLELVLSQRTGGIDEVELERELADIYLHRLGRPDQARRRYEGVLEAAPADAQALEGIKQCQSAVGDWRGYVGSLGRELGLLLGRAELVLDAPEEIDPLGVSPALRLAASQIVSDAAHVVEEQLGDPEWARGLWGLAYGLWPEDAESLERRIKLDRSQEAWEDLARDLEELAALLFDRQARFEALVECARLYADRLGDADAARPLYAEAIALGQDEPALAGLDEARRALQALGVEPG
jgi:tetratricopeptide (TPR) repeat protein